MAPITLERQSRTQPQGINKTDHIRKHSRVLLKVLHVDVLLLSSGVDLKADGLKDVLLHKSVKTGIHSSARKIELIVLRAHPAIQLGVHMEVVHRNSATLVWRRQRDSHTRKRFPP